MVVTVDASAAEGTDTIRNRATITGTRQSLVPTSIAAATESTSVDRQVDLQLTKTDNAESAAPGATLTYVLTPRNLGPSNATGVVLTETLPVGTTFNAALSPGWTETTPGSGTYSFTVGDLPAAGIGSAVNFAVDASGTAAAGQESIVNTARISDDGTAGPDETPNLGSDSNALNAAPDLMLTTSDGDVRARKRRSLDYTLTFANVGAQNASGVVLMETLPAHTSFNFLESTPGWREAVPGSRVFVFEVGDLAARAAPQSVVFSVVVDFGTPNNARRIRNTVSIGDDNNNGADPTPLDNTATEETPLYLGIYAVSTGVAKSTNTARANVRVFDIAAGAETLTFSAYGRSYRGSVHLAVGDMNGDGFDDIITSTATGSGRVRVFDGLTGERFQGVFSELAAFDGKELKGAFIAAGDVTGDGRDDLIAGSAAGGGRVRIFDGVTGARVANHLPFGSDFRGGVRVAVGDVNGDSPSSGGVPRLVDDVIVAEGDGGRTVKVYDGATKTVLQRFKVGAVPVPV